MLYTKVQEVVSFLQDCVSLLPLPLPSNGPPPLLLVVTADASTSGQGFGRRVVRQPRQSENCPIDSVMIKVRKHQGPLYDVIRKQLL